MRMAGSLAAAGLFIYCISSTCKQKLHYEFDHQYIIHDLKP